MQISGQAVRSMREAGIPKGEVTKLVSDRGVLMKLRAGILLPSWGKPALVDTNFLDLVFSRKPRNRDFFEDGIP